MKFDSTSRMPGPPRQRPRPSIRMFPEAQLPAGSRCKLLMATLSAAVISSFLLLLTLQAMSLIPEGPHLQRARLLLSGTANKIGLVVFDGAAWQRVSLLSNSSTIGNCSNGSRSILKPDGTTLACGNLCAGGLIEPQSLPVTGTYTVFIDPFATNTGSITVTPYAVTDVSGTIILGLLFCGS